MLFPDFYPQRRFLQNYARKHSGFYPLFSGNSKGLPVFPSAQSCNAANTSGKELLCGICAVKTAGNAALQPCKGALLADILQILPVIC